MHKKDRERAAKHMLSVRPKTNKGKKYKKHKEHGPMITKERLLKAIKGSYGNKTLIARRLDVGYCAVQLRLKQEGWEDCAEALEAEMHRVADIAERTVVDCMKQDDHLPTRLNAAKFYLSTRARDRGYGETHTVKLEGGDTPVQVEAVNQLPIEKLSLATRLALLDELTSLENDADSDDE